MQLTLTLTNANPNADASANSHPNAHANHHAKPHVNPKPALTSRWKAARRNWKQPFQCENMMSTTTSLIMRSVDELNRKKVFSQRWR